MVDNTSTIISIFNSNGTTRLISAYYHVSVSDVAEIKAGTGAYTDIIKSYKNQRLKKLIMEGFGYVKQRKQNRFSFI